MDAKIEITKDLLADLRKADSVGFLFQEGILRIINKEYWTKEYLLSDRCPDIENTSIIYAEQDGDYQSLVKLLRKGDILSLTRGKDNSQLFNDVGVGVVHLYYSIIRKEKMYISSATLAIEHYKQ